MTRQRRPRIATLTAGLMVAALVAGTGGWVPRVAAATPNPITHWNLVSQNANVAGRPGVSGIYVNALVHVAMYDAVVAIEGGAEPFTSSPSVTGPADADAAVAAAARDVLVARVPSQATTVQAAYDAFLALIPDGAAETNGIAVGQAAAAAVLAERTGDGLDNTVGWVQPATGPGVFEPFPAAPPVEQKFTQIRPIALLSNDQFRPGPPTPLSSDEYAADFNEVKAIGRVDSALRTGKQTETARFWADNPFVQWNRTNRELAVAKGLSRFEAARFLAMVTVANADGLVACFDAKYHYLWWRPLHAIPRAGTDGNGATIADPTWTPLLVVNHPEYPSGHGCASGAVLAAIEAYFGTGKVTITVSSNIAGAGAPRTFTRLNEVRHEIFMARIYGGLHFRSTMGAGFNLGKHVGRYISRNHFAVTD
jgi:hypothetical protein